MHVEPSHWRHENYGPKIVCHHFHHDRVLVIDVYINVGWVCLLPTHISIGIYVGKYYLIWLKNNFYMFGINFIQLIHISNLPLHVCR
jgi:hypothetical protein